MKKLRMITMCLFAMMATSLNVKAQEVTITLMPGWNWISCPLMDTLDFETAMGSFTPVTGDLIKSRWGQAIYTNNHWMGSISQFYPGYGYMYKSNRTMPVFLTFTVQQPGPQVIVTTSEPMDITATSAMVGSTVTIGEGNHIYARGVCYDTVQMPTVDNSHTTDSTGTGVFSTTLIGLTPSVTYYVRAYVVTDYGLAYGEEQSFTTLDNSSNIPEGAINGLFTVNANGDQVYFSQGNLQYQASTNTWRFAENQFDICDVDMEYYIWDDNVGDYVNVSLEEYNVYVVQGGAYYFSNGNASTQYTISYNGWIDLFGWGTSGFNHGAICYQPWSTSFEYSDYYVYGSDWYNLYDQTGEADWGYNLIDNGGNISNKWRTPTKFEWDYLFNTRATNSGIRYAKAQVNGVNGVILLPDDWNSNNFNLNNTNTSNTGFNSNILATVQWTTIENEGAVFLPAAGYRDGTIVQNIGFYGGYWSSSYFSYFNYDNTDAYSVAFYSNHLSTNSTVYRNNGLSVRLIYFAE